MIIERVITIEYLQPSMSQELLCKFPDQSVYDFDYTQSGIWSPLLPRGHLSSFQVSPFEVRRRLLEYDDGVEVLQEKTRKVGSKIKKKVIMAMSMKNKKKMKKKLDFSVTPVTESSPKKGWAKALRAASKPFKKHKVAPSFQIRLQNFLNLGEY
ncbi:hypothetical protein IFM89_019228 [Coptis chinensis]|uniref:Uncharacterized protein n=1 Tax=Coptis chinensis TaxID=261450 RepID=A0A835LNC4_9MAGN|nr:hypothetical protein IFM89_019228 [Coptis chinensis]